jgi:protein phosphatase
MTVSQDHPRTSTARGREVKLDYGACTDKAGRAENEDHCTHKLYRMPGKEALGVLFAVADGMGGGTAGGEASDLAIRTLVEEYFQYSSERVKPLESLQLAVNAANNAVFALGTPYRSRENPTPVGTTMVAGSVVDRILYLTSVGDSRAYLIRGGKIRQLTKDQNWANREIRLGRLTEQEAYSHKDALSLTHVLGQGPNIQMPLAGQTHDEFSFKEELQPGDALVLCSDGLSNAVPQEEIVRLATIQPAQQAAERLVARARQRHTTDNATAVVLHYGPVARKAASGGFPGWLPIAFSGGVVLLIVLMVVLFSGLGRTSAGQEPSEEPASATIPLSVTETLQPTIAASPGEDASVQPASAPEESEEPATADPTQTPAPEETEATETPEETEAPEAPGDDTGRQPTSTLAPLPPTPTNTAVPTAPPPTAPPPTRAPVRPAAPARPVSPPTELPRVIVPTTVPTAPPPTAPPPTAPPPPPTAQPPPPPKL